MLCVECGKKKVYNETFIKLPSKIHRLCEDCLEEEMEYYERLEYEAYLREKKEMEEEE